MQSFDCHMFDDIIHILQLFIIITLKKSCCSTRCFTLLKEAM